MLKKVIKSKFVLKSETGIENCSCCKYNDCKTEDKYPCIVCDQYYAFLNTNCVINSLVKYIEKQEEEK